MRRLGLATLCAVLFAAGVSASALRADPATTADTTTETTSTDETTPATTTASTSTATTTIATTTVATTTARTTTATTRAPPAATTLGSTVQPRAGDCLLAGGVAVLAPGRPPLVLGPVAQAPGTKGATRTGGVVYPADGSIVAASSIELRANGCGLAAGGSAIVRSLSLFGGAIAARRAELVARGAGSSVVGLEIGGKHAAHTSGRRLPVGNWAYAVALPRPVQAKRSVEGGALAVHLLRPHAGLPAGTVLLVAFAEVPTAAKVAAAPKPKPRRVHHRAKARQHVHHLSPAVRRRRRERVEERLGQPLSATPALGLRLDRYVFPVAGHTDYIDTYGAFRGDVPGNWHHGDDIFAALGTPVVAVATGTLNRVGWQRLGGWRLWVRDSRRNEFYYAHLSGYSPLALHSKHVKAGDVIGFVGNTGDAFTTSPHVHFEVHPHQLLRLHYNGAVDPTAYLDHWRHLSDVHAPRPVHPGFPPGEVRQEASYVWRELLASRGLIRHAPSPKERPKIALPRGAEDVAPPGAPALSLGASAAHRGSGGGVSTTLLAVLMAALVAAVAAGLVARGRMTTARLATWRRHGTPVPDGAEDTAAEAPTVSDGVARLAAVARSLRPRA